jgi:Secretion system C-terminal sorting domain
MMKLATIILIFSLPAFLSAQINGYAKVSSYAGTVLTVSNVNQVSHSFAVGEAMVVMQMQDDVIGGNTADNAAFGDLAAISSAGLYELVIITAINGNTTQGFTSATPTTIAVDGLTNSYNTGANSSLQVITFRQMAATDYTTVANITALAWDGNVGGVIAMHVPGTLTLNHNITANGVGFRGGAVSTNYYIGGTACYTTPFRVNNNQAAFKGEGIYKNTLNTYNNARAKILTGGGGGVQINAGGGGGGNYTGGGIGGPGWNSTAAGCSIATGGYGYGGIALSSVIGANRVFMGGGGGGGQQNNSLSTPGGNGGGIILIKANMIVTSGVCAGRTISANGNTPATGGGDGQGGGGAAGSIVFFVNSWAINAGCVLTVAANGGNGGNVNTTTHAGGGAGGQGIVIYSGAQPTTSITTTTNNGNPGCNNNSSPCNNVAGAATGSNNQGIIPNTLNPLPIELIFFTAFSSDLRTVRLEWQTASELNNDFFTVERSRDGTNWEELLIKDGAGNSSSSISYDDVDARPFTNVSYYRLKQTDFDGSFEYSNIVSVTFNQTDLFLYPNPAENMLNVEGMNLQEITIFNALGQDISNLVEITKISDSYVQIDTGILSSGIYFIRCGSTIKTFAIN